MQITTYGEIQVKNIPAILLSEEYKRKQARKEVLKAIEAIKHYGPLIGISGRTMYEYNTLAVFMEKEVKRESKCKEDMDRSTEKRELHTGERTTV